jgi:hypothetical protein
MNNAEFIDWMRDRGACAAAIEWVSGIGYSRREVWENCERADWLLWWAARDGFDHVEIVRAACACARTALKYVPDGEDRPRLAIEAAERWCDDPTEEHRRASADAAYAVADAAANAARAAYAAAYAAACAAYAAARAPDADAAADAAYAACAAADAAYAARAAAYAADAAAYAAYAAADAAADAAAYAARAAADAADAAAYAAADAAALRDMAVIVRDIVTFKEGGK